MAYSLDQIRQFAQDPTSIPAPGRFGEGQVYNIAEMLKNLKDSIKSGQLNVRDYFDIAEPLIKRAQSVTEGLAGGGKTRADAVNPAWKQLQDIGAVKGVNGQWQTVLPFSAREYANLDESVLPTQKEVSSGLVPLDLLPPVQRFRPETSAPKTPVPQVNPGPGGSTVTNPTNAPVTNPPVTSTPDPGVTKIPDPANPGQTINIPVVQDPLQNSVPKMIDQSVIEQEGQRQAEQSRLAYEAEKAIRAQRLSDLQNLLAQQNDRTFKENAPGIYEDLNSRGLLRSSELGNALAREKAKLNAATTDTLAQQGLSDRDAEIQGINDILAKSQQFQTSGLERKFTLEDYAREADTAKQLGSQYAPQVKSGNSVLSGLLGGAGTGASVGGAIGGGPGAGIGAGLGALTGLVAAKGK